MINAEWIIKAVETIKSGLCDKLEKDNILVYRCGKIIRVDIKGELKWKQLYMFIEEVVRWKTIKD